MFPCTICGVCCQNISTVQQLSEFDLGNGICKHYDVKSQECKIYDQRPEICRVDEMFELRYNKTYTMEEFYNINIIACNTLQESHGIDKSFRIKIKD